MNYKQLIQRIGFEFQNEKYLELALSHKSVGAHNNERLEFLGDAILNFIIAGELFNRFPNATEGQLTRMRSYFICEDMLVEIAKAWELGKYIILGTGEQRSGGHQRASILADTVEGILGAIYLDCSANMQIIQQVVLSWYADKFASFDDNKLLQYKDAKTVLQEILQAKKQPLPEYAIIKIDGERHDQTFYVECKTVLLPQSVSGIGNSRRKAEQMAAEKVLEILNVKRK